jgi:nitroimidazol reductase NimA-like FMN-containing flavoprotein (pyridoxamine 5'-phosphate oxidase superfamily)
MTQANDHLKAEISHFLNNNFVMQIAISRNNKPSASVVIYFVDEDLNFYFATHSDSFKAQILISNPQISLCVWKDRQMLVQADGTVSEITDHDQVMDTIHKLLEGAKKGDDFWPPLLKIKGDSYSVFKITPTWLRKLDLSSPSVREGESPFAELTMPV